VVTNESLFDARNGATPPTKGPANVMEIESSNRPLDSWR